MQSDTPVRYGFRAAWRQPALVLAEIAWRWSWGAATLLITWFAAREFLAALDVSHRDEWQLQSGSPQLVADAILHIFHGSGPTILRLLLIVTPAALALWAIAATAGRAATLRALAPGDARLLPRTFALHVFRVLIGMLGFVGIAAAFLLGSVLAGRTDPPNPAIFLAIFFPLALVFTILRSRINWLLLLANVYAARGMRLAPATAGATRVFKRRSGDFLGVGTLIGILRLVLVGGVTILDLALVPFVRRAPAWALWALFACITLAYFAISDWLYIVKLAAYTRIIEEEARPAPGPAAAVVRENPPPQLPPEPATPVPSVPAG